MSGTKTKRAAGIMGGWRPDGPPISRARASQNLKADIPITAWSRIEAAFLEYGLSLDQLGTSRASRSKDTKKASWYQRQGETVAALQSALDRLKAAQKHDRFLDEASENYALVTLGRSAKSEISADRLIGEASKAILDALIIVERADSRDLEVPTAAAARAALISSIHDALEDSGIEAKASSGMYINNFTEKDKRPLTLKDLTPFERLIDDLKICEELTEKSLAVTVRQALSGER